MAALALSAPSHGRLHNRIAHVAPPPRWRTKKTQRKKTHQQRKKIKKQPKKTRCSSPLKKTQPKKTALSNRLIHRTIRTAVADCRNISQRLEWGESSFNQLYRHYIIGAEKREYSFNLTKEQFRILTKGDCHYCGAPPKRQFKVGGKSYGFYIYNGVDRLDNSIGYEFSNCVPCCWPCNKTKGDTTAAAFIALCLRVSQHMSSKILAGGAHAVA